MRPKSKHKTHLYFIYTVYAKPEVILYSIFSTHAF
jgi:hypothetical protein